MWLPVCLPAYLSPSGKGSLSLSFIAHMSLNLLVSQIFGVSRAVQAPKITLCIFFL